MDLGLLYICASGLDGIVVGSSLINLDLMRDLVCAARDGSRALLVLLTSSAV